MLCSKNCFTEVCLCRFIPKERVHVLFVGIPEGRYWLLSKATFTIGLNDLKDLFQPK